MDRAFLPDLEYSPVLKSLLYLRGMDNPDDITRFLFPGLGALRDPAMMKGVPAACERIARAIEAQEVIGVFSDYDVDGVCSAALLHRFLVHIGASAPVVFIPDRNIDGYGLNARGIEVLYEKGVTLLITADCGTTAVDEVSLAASMGMDVIVTDHHEPGEILPPCLALINPKQGGCAFADEDLCGAGVIFHLIVALRALLRERGRPDLPNLRQDLDLVALATVADVVSLSGINRILVKEGLNVLNAPSGVGISALAKVSGIKDQIYARDIAFALGPRINAAGRISSASKAFDLLVTRDKSEAMRAAAELQNLNRKRQMIGSRVTKEAIKKVGDMPDARGVIVVSGEDWPQGVIGIVASRLTEHYGMPAIVISMKNGRGRGSGRSVRGIDLHGVVSAASGHLEGFGGHKMAIGLSIDSRNIQAFAQGIDAVVSGMKPVEPPCMEVDLKISPGDLTPGFMDDLERLAPFGQGNPAPVFMMSGMEIAGKKKVTDKKLKLILKHSGRFFHSQPFAMPPLMTDLPKIVDVAFTPVRRQFRGHTYLYLDLKALSPS